MIRHRKQIRLQNYNYSLPGNYFVTICTSFKELLFGRINDKIMTLNNYGEIVKGTWYELPNHNSNIELDSFVIMPNHFHGLIKIIDNNVGAGYEPAPTKIHGLSEIIRQFKTFSAKLINKVRNKIGTPVWQRNYYEHIIRNEKEYWKVRQYIKYNPINWDKDEYNIN